MAGRARRTRVSIATHKEQAAVTAASKSSPPVTPAFLVAKFVPCLPPTCYRFGASACTSRVSTTSWGRSSRIIHLRICTRSNIGRYSEMEEPHGRSSNTRLQVSCCGAKMASAYRYLQDTRTCPSQICSTAWQKVHNTTFPQSPANSPQIFLATQSVRFNF